MRKLDILVRFLKTARNIWIVILFVTILKIGLISKFSGKETIKSLNISAKADLKSS